MKEHRYDIGLAALRLDGFVAMTAKDEEGALLTRPLAFDVGKLCINAAVGPGGYVKAELLPAGQASPPAGYEAESCLAFAEDSIRGELSWTDRVGVPASGAGGGRIRSPESRLVPE